MRKPKKITVNTYVRVEIWICQGPRVALAFGELTLGYFVEPR